MAGLKQVTEVLHKLKAFLYPCYLEKDTQLFVARSQSEAPLSISDICASAKNRGGYTGSYEDLLQHSTIFVTELLYNLLDGFSITLDDYFTLHLRIKGKYRGATDIIRGSSLALTARQLQKLTRLLDSVKIENSGEASCASYIYEVEDTTSGSLNSQLTPGGVIKISGNKIKVTGGSESCGVWVVEAKPSGARVKIQSGFAINRNAEVITLLPSTLSRGQHYLEVVTNFSGGGRPLKEPRVVRFERALEVL